MANVNQLIEKAALYFHKGRLREAEDICRKILKQQPRSTDALNMSGIIQAQSGNFHMAIEHFTKLLKFDPGHAAAAENIARCYLATGQAKLAHDFYEQALSKNPSSYMALFGQGCALMMLERPKESLLLFDRAQLINPQNALLHLNKATALIQLGDLDAALASFRQSLAIDDNLAEAHSRIGELYLKTGKYDLSESHLGKAIALGNDSPETELDLAEAFELNGKLAQARRHYRSVTEKYPGSQNAYTRFDQFLLRSGSPEKKKFLEHLASDHVFSEWSEAVDAARQLAEHYEYHDSDAVDALNRFLDAYEPGVLHERDWWREQLASFGDPALGHDKLLRSVHSAVFCWSLPDRETLEEIARFADHARLHSYGAGAGVWERLLIEHFDMDIMATEYVLRHRFLTMTFEDYSKAVVDADDVILISWIVRDDTNILNIFEQMRPGQKLVLIGEPPDEQGIPRICASRRIYDLLEDGFSRFKTIPLVSYSLLNDTVDLYIKK